MYSQTFHKILYFCIFQSSIKVMQTFHQKFFWQINVGHWDFSLLKDPLPKTASKIIFSASLTYALFIVKNSTTIWSHHLLLSCLSQVFFCFLWLAQKLSSPSSQQSSSFFLFRHVFVLFSFLIATKSWLLFLGSTESVFVVES